MEQEASVDLILSKNFRYAHGEGHTSLCYDPSSGNIVTCGMDGEVRVWKGVEDEDPKSATVGEGAYALLVKNERIYVATDANKIQILTLNGLSLDGIVTTFDAPVTYMSTNQDCTVMAAGSCDFTIRIIDLKTLEFRIITKHTAPILCVAFDPKDELLASSGCDGTVKIWKLADLWCARSWSLLPKCNDFSNVKTLARMSWHPKTGEFLVVPLEKEIRFYERGGSLNWKIMYTLRDSSITTFFSTTSVSPCGNFLASATVDGFVGVWKIHESKLLIRKSHHKKSSITALGWHPTKQGEIAFADDQGNLCVLDNMCNENPKEMLTEEEILAEFADILEDNNDDEDDENCFSISKIKAETIGLEGNDDDDVSVTGGNHRDFNKDMLSGLDKVKETGLARSKEVEGSKFAKLNHEKMDDYETDSVASHPVSKSLVSADVFKPQPCFQPGSTPVHLQHRFMVWNTVGIIICYDTDNENSIDIEFHDTAVHHAMHVTNMFNYTMAALSTEAVVLAAESQNDMDSKLTCMHFGSWDSCKEWSVDMLSEEEIEGVALGEGWVACVTSGRNLRIFSVGGTQKEVLSVPGPLVSMSGWRDFLVVAYHAGLGIPGDQCISVMLVNIASKCTLVTNQQAPLGPKSTLSWIGFSDEGSLYTSDSTGRVRLYNKRRKAWLQVINTKSYTKGKSDNHFIVGISEKGQEVRSILCKGSKYPPILPRPVVTVLPLQLPLCELDTEKGQLEELFWRNLVLDDSVTEDEMDVNAKELSVKTQQESLLKLFALASRAERDFRASEVADLMATSHAVQVAVKYASRLKHYQLAQRLGDIVYKKMKEEQMEAAAAKPTAVTLAIRNGNYEEEEDNYESENDPPAPPPQRTRVILPEQSRDRVRKRSPSPVSQVTVDDDSMDAQDLSEQLSAEAETSSQKSTGGISKNPFKIKSSPAGNMDTNKGSDMFDNLKKPAYGNKKVLEPIQKKANKNSTPAIKDKPKGPKQMMLFSKKEGDEKIEKEKPKKNGFDLWYSSMKSDLQEEAPDMDEAGLRQLASNRYEGLPDLEKEEWNKKVATSKRKRKDHQDRTENVPSKKSKEINSKPVSYKTNSKLTSFMFKKD